MASVEDSVEENVGKMETQLKKWGAKLDELIAKADEASTEAKVDYHKRVDELKAKHQAATAKLDELKAAGSEKWDSFKTGIESAWSELETAFKKLKN
jgi:ribosome-associated translation inhibitor RaiA